MTSGKRKAVELEKDVADPPRPASTLEKRLAARRWSTATALSTSVQGRERAPKPITWSTPQPSLAVKRALPLIDDLAGRFNSAAASSSRVSKDVKPQAEILMDDSDSDSIDSNTDDGDSDSIDLTNGNQPGSGMKFVDSAHENNQSQRDQEAQRLYDEGMDDDWYITSQSAHVASLSPVGKAEYALHSVSREILRYDNLIRTFTERIQRDGKLIKQLEENRVKADARQNSYYDCGGKADLRDSA